MKRIAALLALALLCCGLSSPARAAQEGGPAHPHLIITPQEVPSLAKRASLDNQAWRQLITWAQSPARREHFAQDGPGLALVSLVLKASNPVLAQRLGQLAVGSAKAGALVGHVQSVGKNSISDNSRLGQAEHLRGTAYNLLSTLAADTPPWRVAQHSSTGLATNPGDPPLNGAFKIGDAYALVVDDPALASQLVGQVALTLDWAWEYFSPQERQETAGWLAAQAKALEPLPQGGFDSRAVHALHASALAGLAIQGLHPQGEALLERISHKSLPQEMLPGLREAGAGGGWFEGSWAGALAGQELLETAAAWQSATGNDFSEGVPWFRDRLSYLLHHLLPGVVGSPRGGYRRLAPDGDQVLNDEDAADLVRQQMLLLTRLRPQDPSLGWAWVLLLDRHTPRVLAESRLFWEFLCQHPDPQLRPLSSAPLMYLAPGLGRVVSRDDWTDLTTWLGFSCGPHFAATQHLDAGSLNIYRLGWLMPRAGAYDGPVSQHAQNYALRTLAHNSLMVFDPHEYSWTDLRDGPQKHGTYANDGGQRAWELFDPQGHVLKQAPWTASGWNSGPAPWEKLRDIYDVAGVEAAYDQPRYAYMRGRLTQAYQGSTHKVSRLVRHVFHLRPGGTDDSESREVIVVADEAVVAQEQTDVRFVLHCVQPPKLAGAVTNLGPGRSQAPANTLRIQEGGSRLDVRCLLPQAALIRVYGQAGVADSWVGDRNYPPRPPALNPAPYRVEIGAAQPQGKERVLLTALLPSDLEASEGPAITPLASASPQVVGLVVADHRWPRVLALHLGVPQEGIKISYQGPAGASRHLVAGLLPDTLYRVEAKEGLITIGPGGGTEGLKSSPAGTLAFKVPDPEPAPEPSTN